MSVTRSTKRQKRQAASSSNCGTKNHLELRDIGPITDNQVKTFQYYNENKNVFLLGCAGTGKTFLSLYLALKEILYQKTDKRQIVIIRTAQPTKQIGFLPGDEATKMDVYEAPYRAICSELFNRDDAYEILKQKGVIVFAGTSFLRGCTINESIIIADEVQNCGYQELRTVLTRPGDKSKIILCGDTRQDDLTSKRYNEFSGIQDIMKVLGNVESMKTVIFDIDDIVRSNFVRDFIIAEYEAGI